MAYEDIYARYKNLYDAQDTALKKKKDAAILELNHNKDDLTNQYTDIADGLKTKSDNTKIQYGNLYKTLDQQNSQAKEQNYTDRNNVDVGVNQNLNRVQELMAKNGWLGGGENLQAQLQSGSDRMNGFGNADRGMNDKFSTIMNNRNTYQGQEQAAIEDINNQITSNDREKLVKIQGIVDAINAATTNYDADTLALKAGLDAQAEAEVYNAQQIADQRAYEEKQRQITASSTRSSSGSSSGSSRSSSSSKSSNTDILKATQTEFNRKFTDGTAGQWLNENAAEIREYVGDAEYFKMVDKVNKNKQKLSTNKRKSTYRVGAGAAGRQLMPD